jgi:hypothetical protein
MADWRQIQARIRKAKNSADPLARLAELFAKTRDAMVAFEAAAIEEKAGRNDEAIRWYTTAAERFRRAEWKKKAGEALTRLGAPIPASIPASPAEELQAAEIKATEVKAAETEEDVEPRETFAEAHATGPVAAAVSTTHAETGQAAAAEKGHKRRRRGRRGGRGRRRGAAAATPALPQQAFTEPAAPAPPVQRPAARIPERAVEEPLGEAIEPPRPARIEQPPAEVASRRSAHGRAGEPALASRLNHLEAMLRRLVSSPVHGLDEAEEAPAGPGVFLLSDSDLVTSYYVEACQTLRVGLGHVARGGRGGRNTGGAMRSRLADYLGISDTKVSSYLKQHCVVRWIQLDEDAGHLAHFAISVLRTPLNAD